MNRDYDYMGYVIRVSTEPIMEPALRKLQMIDRGYIALVAIYKPEDSLPCCPEMRLTDLGDRWFSNEVDALMRGFSVGRRIVEDGLGRRAA